jgi:hypothetical protein
MHTVPANWCKPDGVVQIWVRNPCLLLEFST